MVVIRYIDTLLSDVGKSRNEASEVLPRTDDCAVMSERGDPDADK
jgi:hypothetical protein